MALRDRVRDWLTGSDPGLLRLRMAVRTTLTLASALLVLYLLTKATGEPVTVALLGVVIAMLSAMAVNEPDPRQQKITMALLPVPGAAAVTLGALLAPHMVAGDVAFVAIIFAAVYARRFGGRGMALGMVTFMTYFFALFLRAKVDQLPWLIGAVLVGTACSFLMGTYVLPERPERVLRHTLRALWARVAAVIDTAGAALQAGHLDERDRRQLRRRTARLNETALMVESQLDDKVDAAALWPGVGDDELALRLFDVELAAERLAAAGGHAATAAGAMPADTRTGLIKALALLRIALRDQAPPSALDRAEHLAEHLLERPGSSVGALPAGTEAHRLALAIAGMATAAAHVRTLVDRAAAEPAVARESTPESPPESPPEQPPGEEADSAQADSAQADSAQTDGGGDEQPASLRPTTRQAIQVAIAASLAIVAGELLSPARWYWAVIATFVIFTGTTSRGETLTKGWQRLVGTALGVPAGVLIATAVGGDTVWSLVLIFVCLFCGFYLIKVAYSLMIFWITTMLALLYGLLGLFSVGLLLLRIEETAIGAGIGITVAVLVLPTSTRTTVRDAARTFLATLSDLVGAATQTLLGEAGTQNLTDQARELDEQLQQLRASAKPLTDGVAGIRGRGSARRGLRVLTACDHYARTLARSCAQPGPALIDPAVAGAVRSAAERVSGNIDALADLIDHREHATVHPATDLLDAAENATDDRPVSHLDGRPDGHADGSPSAYARGRLCIALRSLRHIDQAVVDLACDLGAAQQVTVQEKAPVTSVS